MADFNYWTIFFTSLFSGLSAYFGVYLKKKAEIKAINEQHETLLIHLSNQTEVTEKIKSQFGLIKEEVQQKNWVEQQKWEFRKELFLSMITIILDIRNFCLLAEKYLDKVPSLNGMYEGDEAKIDEKEHELFDQANNIYNGQVKELTVELKSLVNKKGVLFLSPQVMAVLNDFFNAEEIRKNNIEKSFQDDIKAGKITKFNISSPDTFENYLYHKSKAAELAYKALVKAAKEDLRINT